MSNLLAHISDRVLNQPLAILPAKLAIISSVLEGRIGVESLAPGDAVPNSTEASRHIGNYELDPTSSSGARKPYRTTAEGVAIIPIIGSLVGRGGWLQSISGITSYENLKFALNAAANDKTVQNIVLDIDSPGGEAIGAFEVADAVRAAAAKKQVTAVATGLCCSAAYAIASAANSIIITQSSVMGSVGVVLMHADYSHKLHDAGVVPTLIHAGKRKVDGSPYRPLTDDVKASLQTEVDKFNSLFVAAVAKGRPKLTPEAILSMEAGTYIGADAVTAGLADAVGSFEGVIAGLSARSGRRAAPPAKSAPASIGGIQLSDLTPAPKAEVMPHLTTSSAGPSITVDASMVDATVSLQKQDSEAIARMWGEVVANVNGERPRASLPAGSIEAGWDDAIAVAAGKPNARPMSGPGAEFWNDAIARVNGSNVGRAKIGYGWDDVVARVNGEMIDRPVLGPMWAEVLAETNAVAGAASRFAAENGSPTSANVWDDIVDRVNAEARRGTI